MPSSVSLFSDKTIVSDIRTLCGFIPDITGPIALTCYPGLKAEPDSYRNKANKCAIDLVKKNFGPGATLSLEI